MFHFSRFFAFIWCLGVLARLTSATVDPLEIEGSRFVYKTNRTVFSIRGISFSPSSSTDGALTDPLADRDACASLVPTLLDLGINVLAIRYVNINTSHTGCLDVLGEAGIYTYATMPDPYLGKDGGWDQLASSEAVKFMDSFENNNASLGISVGRLDATTDTLGVWSQPDAGPFYKAAIRDLKRHNSDKGFRNIPIGIDVFLEWPEGNVMFHKVLNYLACGDVHPDFIALWGSGPDTGHMNPHRIRPEDIDPFIPLIANYSIPVFMKNVYSSFENRSIDGGRYIGDNRMGTYGFISRIFEEEINGTINKLNGAIVESFIADDYPGGQGVYAYIPSLQNVVATPVVLSAGLSKRKTDTLDGTMPGFLALSTAFADVKSRRPVSEQSIASPTITACAAPDVLNVSLKLPPQNYPELCSCMEASLRCVQKTESDLSHSQNIDEVCGKNKTENCVGIMYDTERGHYGAYSVCEPSVKYSYAADRFWRKHGNDSCDLDGTVHLRGEYPPPYPQCSILLQKAGVDGENTVDPMVFSTSYPSVSPTDPGRTSDLSSAHSGLSTGSKAGIAVGTVIFAIFVAIGVVFLFLRRKRAAKAMKTEDTPFQKSELDGKQVTKADYLQEVGDEGAVRELYVKERAHEITTLNDERIELPVEERPVETQA